MEELNLTVDEVRDLLVARYRLETSRKKKIEIPFPIPGIEVSEPSLESRIFLDKLQEFSFDSLARRLVSDVNSDKLLLDEDFEEFSELMLERLKNMEDIDVGAASGGL